MGNDMDENSNQFIRSDSAADNLKGEDTFDDKEKGIFRRLIIFYTVVVILFTVPCILYMVRVISIKTASIVLLPMAAVILIAYAVVKKKNNS